MTISLSEEKLHKVRLSLERALENISIGNKIAAKGDIHFIIDRAYEALYLLEAEIDELFEK